MDNKDSIVYCINNQIHFVPQQNKLISCKTGKEHVTYVTASRCLHLLICQSGEMVSHHSLYAAGWENHGKIVTPNTLYQTISKLRKQLQDAGLTENIIQTHPRRGWSISDKVPIEEKAIGAIADTMLQQQGLKGFCRKIFSAYPKKMLTSIARFR
ncbi:DNA-binding winged helix-turn-helix (wHTH) protein [Erwinia persicina]|jgi:DNA-binding winged helix-turn-helix (wHTH) protein|uniref:Transcriptional regulator n=2 Tax=Erwinia TaxID=551 RepID=A0ABV4E5I0_9GAMM|nr:MULTISPECIES: winged helix-turn-helix domain-containing protein [Erwinia]MCP1438531.1 DNA-binding winged helix-turn-helix (wHTH) protein [Erwinia persicina]MDN4628845.1 winged helix-turn-helix domain-containing protein [Erwinia sp. PsM31]MDN8542156.1 winged helix-turn-helix domain-containing protein [Erwinia sp. BC051422]